MHELAITQSILEIALKAAGEQNASRIRVISLVMGPFSGVVPECGGPRRKAPALRQGRCP